MYKPDDRIGPYTLIREIGRGAFGIVWLAERRGSITTTKIALKIALVNELDLEAIKQEASLWVQASGHPNVLPIIEADVYDGQSIIASEYAADGSLADWFSKIKECPSVEIAVEITSGILAGLVHLHSKRIIHRDIKPANILLQGLIPRLTDFGIASIISASTQSTFIKGTPAYMAPEAFEGERSIQTDIWSVGTIFYRLLSGQLPFPQKDSASLIWAVISKDPAPLPTSVPSSLQDIVYRALQKNPSYRFESANSMREALLNTGRFLLDEEATIIRPKKKIAQSLQTIVSDKKQELCEVMHFCISTEYTRSLCKKAATNANVTSHKGNVTCKDCLDLIDKYIRDFRRFSVEEFGSCSLEERIEIYDGEIDNSSLNTEILLDSSDIDDREWIDFFYKNRIREVSEVLEQELQELRGIFGQRHIAELEVSDSFSSDKVSTVSDDTDEAPSQTHGLIGDIIFSLKHSEEVESISFSPDGKILASGSKDCSVCLWNACTGEVKHVMTEHTSSVKLLSFSHDGKKLVSGGADNILITWNGRSGKLVQSLELKYELIALSIEGKSLATNYDGVALCDLQTGEQKLGLKGHRASVKSAAFSLDGTIIATGSYDNTVKLWNLPHGTLLQTLKGHSEWVECVAFSPNGKIIASGGWDSRVKLWDVQTGTLLRTIKEQNKINSVAFSPDNGVIACAGLSEDVRLWDIETGILICTLRGHERSVNSVIFSPNGMIVATASEDNGVLLWDVSSLYET